jgi:hypothetical protein
VEGGNGGPGELGGWGDEGLEEFIFREIGGGEKDLNFLRFKNKSTV